MKIAVITSGLLPVPATKGGAIETLLDSFVKENEKKQKIDIEIYSKYEKNAAKESKKYLKTKYVYITNFFYYIFKILNKLIGIHIPINKYFQNRVIKIINKKDYDYIIIENYPELVLKIKEKCLLYIHSDVLNKDTKNCNEILNKAYKIFTVSEFIKNRIDEIDTNNKTITIYNSIDFTRLDYSNIRNIYRSKLGIENNDIVFGYSGRISEEKGVLELVKAFNKINIDNKKLVIIGGIWYGISKENDYLRKIKDISDSNIIFTGYIEHKELEKYLCALDIGVVPSLCNEAAGLSVVEFMYTHNIVVAADKGGIKEYLNLNSNVLVNTNNNYIDNLAEGLENAILFNNEKNIQNNLNFVNKFTIDNNYRSIIDNLK